MNRHSWHVCVVIPARNEEKLLPRCLQSVLAAAAAIGDAASTDIVVVADRSTDGTRLIAATLLEKHGAVTESNAGIVGTARALGVRTGLSRSRTPLHRCWVANTDADCCVPKTWLIDQLRLAGDGVEAMAGTVSVDSFNEHAPHVAERFRATYTISKDGSHPHVHGANMGLRADVYRSSGGWRHVSTGEDHDLWRRLRRTGAQTVSTNRVEVVTSGRRVGRAPSGFAAALSAHNHGTRL